MKHVIHSSLLMREILPNMVRLLSHFNVRILLENLSPEKS